MRMFYQVEAKRVVPRKQATRHRLMGWWKSDRDMISQLNTMGFLVVAWTKR